MRNTFVIALICLFVSACSMHSKDLYREGYRAGMKSALKDFKDKVNTAGPIHSGPATVIEMADGMANPALGKSERIEENEMLGNRYLAQGDYDRAFVHYTRALQRRPGRKDIRFKVGMLYLGQGLLEEAKTEFQKLIKEDKNYAPAYQGMGQVWLASNRHYDEAKKYFMEAARLDPRFWQARNFLGIIYDYQGKYDKAIEEYRAAIAYKPDEAFLYNNLGVCYYLQGEYNKAVQTFKEALGKKTNSPRVYNNMGLALGELRRYEEALEAFRKGGSEAQAYNNLGCVYMKHGKYREANRAFARAIELAPQFYGRANNNLKKAGMHNRKGSSEVIKASGNIWPPEIEEIEPDNTPEDHNLIPAP